MEHENVITHRKDVHDHQEHPVSENVYSHYDEKPVPFEDTPVDDPLNENDAKKVDGEVKDDGLERAFDGVGIPPWREQLTIRAFVVSVILGTVFCVIVLRLSLTVGVIPSLNVSAGLLGFLLVKGFTSSCAFVARRFPRLSFGIKPFTRQENTVIQTCVVACYGLAFSGGFGFYLLGMSSIAVSPDAGGENASQVKEPKLKWILPYLAVITLQGIFVLVPLRKIMIIDYKLTYPSGTATAVLINSFHTPSGAALAMKQGKSLTKYFSFSFAWSFFKWFFAGEGCGFDTFPSLGLKAYQNRFNFDFNMTYIGAGMICPHIVNCSILLGAIVSWGLMWPLILKNEGKWFPANAGSTDFNGMFGYKVFLSIGLILGDGLYNLVRVSAISCHKIYTAHRARLQLPTSTIVEQEDLLGYDEKRRNRIFMKDGIPYWVALAGYLSLAVIAIIVVPFIFDEVKWYYMVIAYCIGPVFAFCNAYGTGLTDWSLVSTYGKIFLFIFASWAGQNGGIIAGLAMCGVAMVMVGAAADLMQDFKTGYLTLSSPRSMFISQLIGGALGVLLAPSTFWMFYTAFDVGGKNSIYKAPYAQIYRAMSVLGVEGFGGLPKHCIQLSVGWFAFAIVVCLIRDLVPKKVSRFIPIPMAMAIPFYLGAYFAIDMFIGTCIVFIWERRNRKKADTFKAAIASGLICGDGMWTIPAALLQFAKVNSPICMTFFPAKVATSLGYPLYSN